MWAWPTTGIFNTSSNLSSLNSSKNISMAARPQSSNHLSRSQRLDKSKGYNIRVRGHSLTDILIDIVLEIQVRARLVLRLRLGIRIYIDT